MWANSWEVQTREFILQKEIHSNRNMNLGLSLGFPMDIEWSPYIIHTTMFHLARPCCFCLQIPVRETQTWWVLSTFWFYHFSGFYCATKQRNAGFWLWQGEGKDNVGTSKAGAKKRMCPANLLFLFSWTKPAPKKMQNLCDSTILFCVQWTNFTRSHKCTHTQHTHAHNVREFAASCAAGSQILRKGFWEISTSISLHKEPDVKRERGSQTQSSRVSTFFPICCCGIFVVNSPFFFQKKSSFSREIIISEVNPICISHRNTRNNTPRLKAERKNFITSFPLEEKENSWRTDKTGLCVHFRPRCVHIIYL